LLLPAAQVSVTCFTGELGSGCRRSPARPAMPFSAEEFPVSRLGPSIDLEGLYEYAVVFTDGSLNHMTAEFQQVVRDISPTVRQGYHADGVGLVPGGGTYGREAVARQFARDQLCLVLRNGWFSYRWSQIFAATELPSEEIVLKARPIQ